MEFFKNCKCVLLYFISISNENHLNGIFFYIFREVNKLIVYNIHKTFRKESKSPKEALPGPVKIVISLRPKILL